MEGWRPVEDVIQWGFAQRPVVMANEAHNGLARSVRTRVIGARMIRAAHEAGVRRLAMEALPHRRGEPQGPILTIPPDREGYLAQPDMQRLIGSALDLGWTLWAYEVVIEVTPDTDQEHLRGMEFTNWVRELLDSVAGTLAAHGGTAGILRDQAPPLLAGWAGVDALVVSTDNEMTA